MSSGRVDYVLPAARTSDSQVIANTIMSFAKTIGAPRIEMVKQVITLLPGLRKLTGTLF